MEWSAWTPADGPPDVSAIAPLLRRRMSPLTRMAISVGLACCKKAGLPPGEPRVVFASRHGEMGTTVDLLGQMRAGETLSPTGFSNSVHHAAVGYWSLATLNRQPMRAVAGGEASFCYGFLEAAGMLGERDASPVLLIAADDHVRAPFDAIAGDSTPYAVAFLLEPAAAISGLAFRMEGRMPKLEVAERLAVNPALAFLEWYLKGEKSLELVASERLWRWKR